jgi:hypothetical protein
MNLVFSVFVFRYLKNSTSFQLIVNKCYFSTNKPEFKNNYGNGNNSGNDNHSKKNGSPESNNKPKLDNR